MAKFKSEEWNEIIAKMSRTLDANEPVSSHVRANL